MRLRNWLLVSVLIPGASATTLAQPKTSIKTIEIHSRWSGLGPAGESNLRIDQHDGTFQSNGKRIDNRLVIQLLQEIDASADFPTLQNLGITDSWLQAKAGSTLPDKLRESPQSERNLFLDSFRNIRLVEKLLPDILRQGWTDDYPRIELRVVRSDGSTTLVGSERQNIFMTPFGITEQGRLRLSYNANLSRSIAALLPNGFTNRERLSGVRLASEVAEKVMTYLQDDLSLLETKNRLGPEVKQLEGRYTLQETAINYVSSVDVETVGGRSRRWNAELQRNDLAKNIRIGVSLPYENNKLANFDLFLRNIDAIVALPLSVPWLSRYFSEHPETTMEIRFVTDRSMSPKAVSYFADTMKSLSAEALLAEVQPLLGASSFVVITTPAGWSRWVVLPDRRMVLFDFQGNAVLRWRPGDFETRTRYDTKFWRMAKAVINPEGQIVSR
jgi:hypothetical protein